MCVFAEFVLDGDGLEVAEFRLLDMGEILEVFIPLLTTDFIPLETLLFARLFSTLIFLDIFASSR